MDQPEIKLWQGEIAARETDYPQYWRILDSIEQQYANTINNVQRHRRYVEIHARLRILLGDAVKAAPEQLLIHKAEYGKPYLADYPELAFNLSHTGNQMVLAMANNCYLGVDIEQCKPRKNLTALVDKCFAEEEKNYWQKLLEAQQIRAFYQLWVRKEAFVKATGRGIALGLNNCVVNPESQNELLRIPENYGLASEWLVQAIDLGEPVCGAVVAKNKAV